MAYSDEMQPGSFRGVKFHATESNGRLGRRNVVNQYPLRDEAGVEDLGLLAREFTLEIFLLGDDVFTQRKTLEAAFEAYGSGKLIHPWRGEMNVAVTSCSDVQTIDEGGKIKYTVTFTRDGGIVNPSVRPDTKSAVITAADNAHAVNQTIFDETFNVDQLPEFVGTSALGQINEVLDTVLSSAKAMLPDIGLLSEYNLASSTTLSKLTSLIRSPLELASAITGQITGISGLASGPVYAFDALQKLFGYGKDKPKVVATTPARTAQANNQNAINVITSRAAVIEAARASASIEYVSVDQAAATRDIIVEQLETESLTAPDELFYALNTLRVAVIKDINLRSANLSKVVNYTPKATLPALVLAYQIYGDSTRADEIVSRNRIAHPGFVQGGATLEILNDA